MNNAHSTFLVKSLTCFNGEIRLPSWFLSSEMENISSTEWKRIFYSFVKKFIQYIEEEITTSILNSLCLSLWSTKYFKLKVVGKWGWWGWWGWWWLRWRKVDDAGHQVAGNREGGRCANNWQSVFVFVCVFVFVPVFVFVSASCCWERGKGALEWACLDWEDVIIIGGLRRVFVSAHRCGFETRHYARSSAANKGVSSLCHYTIHILAGQTGADSLTNLFRVIVKVPTTSMSPRN